MEKKANINPLLKEWINSLNTNQLVCMSLAFGLNSKGLTCSNTEISNITGININNVSKILDSCFEILNFNTYTPLKEALLNEHRN